MPLGDWQFWVVTAAAIVGLWAIARVVRPKRRGASRKVKLTVEGAKGPRSKGVRGATERRSDGATKGGP